MRKSKYAKIGRSGSGDEFVKAFKRVADPELFHGKCTDKRKILTDEAVQAFCDGHPEKVQAMLSARPALFGNGYYYNNFVFDALRGITEKSDDKPAVINLALTGLPEEKRKEVLGQALYRAMGSDGSAELFIDLLLKSGADPNVEVNDNTGWVLARAVINNKPDSVIKSLYDNGARFEDALRILQDNHYYQKYIASLLLQREKLERKPGAAPEEQSERLLQLEQRVDELVVGVQRLTSLLETALGPPKAEEEAVQPGIRLRTRLIRSTSAP